MKLSRRLAARGLAVSALGAGLGAIVCLAAGVMVAVSGGAERMAPLFHQGFTQYLVPACVENPAAFSLVADNGITIYAYDGTTGRSANPDAPTIDAELVGALATEPYAFEIHPPNTERRGGTYVIPVDGPPGCDVMGISWSSSLSVRLQILLLLVVMLGGAGTAVLLGGGYLVIRPVTRRISRLREAAAAIGDPGYVGVGATDDGDELDALGQSLDRAHERIRADADVMAAQNSALQTHLADVAHDLRTPLSSLQLTLEHLEAAAPEGDGLRAELRLALDEVLYLTGLTENLRLASQLRDVLPGSEPREVVDLSAVVRRVANRQQVLARRRGVALEVAVPSNPVRIWANETMAEQAIGNVVHNAAAYGEPGGHVAVVLEVDDDTFTLEVLDDGPGVLPEELPRLGERTFRSDEARERDPHGTGLGLAITSSVCERHGWTLTLSANEPRGIRAEITGQCHPARS